MKRKNRPFHLDPFVSPIVILVVSIQWALPENLQPPVYYRCTFFHFSI